MTIKSHPAAGAASARVLSIDDLRPADILLSKGEGFVSDLIADSDGGQFSHGALWSGMGIIQATGDGITLSEIHGRHAVYRYPDLPEGIAKEIVAIATAQVNGRYAYGELVMLGTLFLSGIRIKGALFSRLLDAIGGPTASKLKAWLDRHAGKRARVCTELVASAYYEAAGGECALKIRSRGSDGGAVVRGVTAQATRGAPAIASGVAPVVEDEHLQEDALAAAQSCLDLLIQNDLNPTPLIRKVLAGAIAVDAATNALIGVVTPADLEFSPSLQLVGRLSA